MQLATPTNTGMLAAATPSTSPGEFRAVAAMLTPLETTLSALQGDAEEFVQITDDSGMSYRAELLRSKLDAYCSGGVLASAYGQALAGVEVLRASEEPSGKGYASVLEATVAKPLDALMKAFPTFGADRGEADAVRMEAAVGAIARSVSSLASALDR